MEGIINYIRSKSSTCQALLCAFLVTSIFSLRYINCLPFSGYMPIIPDHEILGYYGRYLIYARESFSFPIGLIKNLCFPFHAANMARGPIPLFAILFKLLSKIHAPFSEFYYYVFVEFLAVFFAAFFTCLLLRAFKIRSFWINLLGAVLVSLSFPLLFRASIYYHTTINVMHFPIYLAFAYFYIQMYKSPNWKYLTLLGLVCLIASLNGYYILFGIFFLLCICLCFNFVEFIVNRSWINRNRIVYVTSAFVLATVISFTVLYAMGNQGNLKKPSKSPLAGRYRQGWGYGGGYGGGFHVADVLTVFLPPEEYEGAPPYKNAGPSAYLTKLGFPITTADLQDGQVSNAFTYLGTTTIGILFILLLIKALSLIRNYRIYFVKFRLKFASKLFMGNELFSLPVILGISSFLLYIMSWGYIIHIGGIRFNYIPTPTLLLTTIFPKFMYARGLGKLAIPLMLFITIEVVIYLGKYLHRYMCRTGRWRKYLAVLVVIFLIIAHVYEVRGYLVQSKVIYGNEIANMFGHKDRVLIKDLMRDKKALMVVPEFVGKLNWGKICYSLAFHSTIPISGATIGPPGERAEHLKRYSEDINYILSGNVKRIIDRYGDVAIVAPSKIAEKILRRSDIPLIKHSLRDQDVMILTLDK